MLQRLIGLTAFVILLSTSCKKSLDVPNPNAVDDIEKEFW